MSAPPLPAVQTLGLTRSYGSMVALNTLDLTINQGDLFGFIGSNVPSFSMKRPSRG